MQCFATDCKLHSHVTSTKLYTLSVLHALKHADVVPVLVPAHCSSHTTLRRLILLMTHVFCNIRCILKGASYRVINVILLTVSGSTRSSASVATQAGNHLNAKVKTRSTWHGDLLKGAGRHYPSLKTQANTGNTGIVPYRIPINAISTAVDRITCGQMGR